MPQPIKKSNQKRLQNKKQPKKVDNKKSNKKPLLKNKKHPEYGVSKLEDRFASEFLDKLGLKYVRQYKAESIGRYFDFRIEPRGPIIEINGTYWHGDPRIYEEKDLNRTQKRDIRVDEYKKAWCSRNGIKLIYIWEMDINKSPDKVLRYLKEVLKPFIDINSGNNRDKKIKKNIIND